MNKILIIDDDRELCTLIKRSVLSENIEADFCNTGKTGLQKLKEQEAEAARQAQFNAIFNDTYEDDDEDDWRREPSYDTEEYPEELRQMHNQQYGSGNYQG